ncbi:MAG: hypothetical protein K6F26_02080 [Lachnospiraceae bacterium]|nr:hypothetical protein [Lachnospiraceae bacterium]
MTMKVSKRDISILLIALGLIGAFCVYQFYFRGAMDKKKTYEEETKTLQTRLDKLNGVDENKLVAQMAAQSEALRDKAKGYPIKYLYEDLIMYLNDWQELPYDEIYTEIYNFPEYEITETEMQEPLTGILDWDQSKRVPIEATYYVGKATIEANYETNGYKAFKDMLNKIYLDPKPKTIREVSAAFAGETGYVSGYIEVDFFNADYVAQEGEEKNTYEPVKIDDVKKGVENIFGPTYTPTPTPTPTPDPRQQTRRFDEE